MHYLHRILVYIPDICSVGKNYPGATKQQIRSYAKYQTECFDGHAFDWRETMTAGRWGYEYPENVLLAADNPERFQKELQTAQSFQQEAMNQALKYLEDNDYLDLKKLAAAVMEDAQDSPSTQHSLSMAAYYLGCFADLIKGTYFYNSFFYDTHRNTSRLNKQVFERSRQIPSFGHLSSLIAIIKGGDRYAELVLEHLEGVW